MAKKPISFPTCAIKSPERAREEAQQFAELKKKQDLEFFKKNADSILLAKNYLAPLSNKIKIEYNKLVSLILKIPKNDRPIKNIEGTAGIVCISDIVAYQIGWGKLLLTWYLAGIRGELPEMPGEGFSTWDYNGLATLFYKKYHYDGDKEQLIEFFDVVTQIIFITEKEEKTGNLEKLGIFEWCTLASGKEWPLSKWIIINSVSPYKRAIRLIRQKRTI